MRLVGVQIWALLVNMLSIGNFRGKKQKALYMGVGFFAAGLGVLMFFYCFAIGQGLMMFNSIGILPALIMVIISLMVLITTVFKVKGTIFGFRDYDMVMSLPVSTGGVVASRLILLYAINMLFVLIVMVPMIVTYGILAKPEVLFYVYSIIIMFFLPLVPIIVASFIGTLITYIASKFRHSNFVSILVSLIFLVAFIGFSFTMGNSGKELVNISKALTDQVNSMYPLADMYTKAVIQYDFTSFIAFLAISIGAFLIYSILIGSLFKKINTTIMTGRYKSNFKMGELKETSPFQALYRKELKRFFSSTLYVLNTGIGVVLLTIAAVALIFVNLDKLMGIPEASVVLLKMVPVYVSFCVVMCFTSASSISLEGKSLWIIKSLPVEPKTIYFAKIAVNLTIVAPVLFDVILIDIILHLGLVKGIIMLLVAILGAVFISIWGILVNLRFPNFNWTSEVTVIKQSAASMVSVFTGFILVGIQVGFIMLIPNYELGYLIYILLLAAVDFALYRILLTWGNKRFLEL